MKLDVFYHNTFAPDWLQTCNRGVLQRYMMAVDWFILWSGKVPSLDSLTDENLEAFGKWLGETKRVHTMGKSNARARMVISRLRQIKRYAQSKSTLGKKDMRVIDFVAQVYFEVRQLTELAKRTYRKCVHSLSRFFGSEIMLSELTLSVVSAWSLRLKNNGTHGKGVILSIWRLAFELGYATVSPDGGKENGKPSAMVVTQGDSLRMLMTSKYFPTNAKIRSDQTKHQYAFAINNLSESLGREPTLQDLTDDNIAAMMLFLVRKNLAPRTINERRGRIHTFWLWLAKRGYVSTWPTTAKLIEPERTPRAWTREQLAAVFAAGDRERIIIAGVPGPLWWKSLHYGLWDTGERITALMNCEWKHLDGEWLTVPAEIRKGRKKDMVYRLDAETVAAIAEIRKPERTKIWPWPYCTSYLWIRYKIIRKRAGLPTDRRSAFHRLRKSVASHFEAAGGNATELFGHSSRSVTRAYLDPTIVKPKQAIDLLFRPAGCNGNQDVKEVS